MWWQGSCVNGFENNLPTSLMMCWNTKLISLPKGSLECALQLRSNKSCWNCNGSILIGWCLTGSTWDLANRLRHLSPKISICLSSNINSWHLRPLQEPIQSSSGFIEWFYEQVGESWRIVICPCADYSSHLQYESGSNMREHGWEEGRCHVGS